MFRCGTCECWLCEDDQFEHQASCQVLSAETFKCSSCSKLGVYACLRCKICYCDTHVLSAATKFDKKRSEYPCKKCHYILKEVKDLSMSVHKIKYGRKTIEEQQNYSAYSGIIPQEALHSFAETSNSDTISNIDPTIDSGTPFSFGGVKADGSSGRENSSDGGFSFGGIRADHGNSSASGGGFSFGGVRADHSNSSSSGGGGFSFGGVRADHSNSSVSSGGGFSFGGVRADHGNSSGSGGGGGFSFGGVPAEHENFEGGSGSFSFGGVKVNQGGIGGGGGGGVPTDGEKTGGGFSFGGVQTENSKQGKKK